MKSIITFSRIAVAVSVTAVLMLSVAMPVMAQNTLRGDFVDPTPGQGGSSNASLTSCSTVATEGVKGLVGCILGFFNTAIGLIIAAAVVYTVWGAFTMIRSEEKREEGKKIIMYGIIGIFVMVSIWGLVSILTKTFGTATPGAGDLKAPTLIQP